MMMLFPRARLPLPSARAAVPLPSLITTAATCCCALSLCRVRACVRPRPLAARWPTGAATRMPPRPACRVLLLSLCIFLSPAGSRARGQRNPDHHSLRRAGATAHNETLAIAACERHVGGDAEVVGSAPASRVVSSVGYALGAAIGVRQSPTGCCLSLLSRVQARSSPARRCCCKEVCASSWLLHRLSRRRKWPHCMFARCASMWCAAATSWARARPFCWTCCRRTCTSAAHHACRRT